MTEFACLACGLNFALEFVQTARFCPLCGERDPVLDSATEEPCVRCQGLFRHSQRDRCDECGNVLCMSCLSATEMTLEYYDFADCPVCLERLVGPTEPLPEANESPRSVQNG